MIAASLQSESANWLAQQPAFAPAFKFLQNQNLVKMSVGKHQITPDMMANVQEYPTKEEKDGRWESHQRYIDFQFIVSGEEYVRITDPKDLKIKTDALAEKDALYYEKFTGPCTDVLLHANDFVILFPEDAHEATINVTSTQNVKKVVIKVPVNI